MAETHMIFGTAVLTTLDILRAHKLLTPHTPSSPARIPNIGLVLSLFIAFVSDWNGIGGDRNGETSWPWRAMQMADEAGVEIKGRYGTEAKVVELRRQVEEEELRSDASDDEIERGVEAVVEAAKRGRKWRPVDDRFGGKVRIWRKWDWKIEVGLPFPSVLGGVVGLCCWLNFLW